MRERNLLTALLQGKCPHCRQGNMFTYPLKKLSKFNVMNAACPYCGIRLEPEPGFYQGAMYVGYGFTIAFISLVSAILYSLGDMSEWHYIGASIGGMTLLIPLNYRYARIVYLYCFGGIKYDRRLSQTK